MIVICISQLHIEAYISPEMMPTNKNCETVKENEDATLKLPTIDLWKTSFNKVHIIYKVKASKSWNCRFFLIASFFRKFGWLISINFSVLHLTFEVEEMQGSGDCTAPMFHRNYDTFSICNNSRLFCNGFSLKTCDFYLNLQQLL